MTTRLLLAGSPGSDRLGNRRKSGTKCRPAVKRRDSIRCVHERLTALLNGTVFHLRDQRSKAGPEFGQGNNRRPEPEQCGKKRECSADYRRPKYHLFLPRPDAVS